MPKLVSGSVIFDNVSKSYGDVAAVKNVSFEIESGQFFSILGPSGCGKTTTGKLILGLETPSFGTIYYNNTNIHTTWHRKKTR